MTISSLSWIVLPRSSVMGDPCRVTIVHDKQILQIG
jgi:hypothetical protein